jgi:DNA-binding MarR family transcriptional regulator
MATVDVIRKFAKQAIPVEHILQEYGIAAKAGRVVLALYLANRPFGIPQIWLVRQMALPKHAISKLLKSLVKAGLVTHFRDDGDPRNKTVIITQSGRDALCHVEDSLRRSRPKCLENTPKALGFEFASQGKGLGDSASGESPEALGT